MAASDLYLNLAKDAGPRGKTQPPAANRQPPTANGHPLPANRQTPAADAVLTPHWNFEDKCS